MEKEILDKINKFTRRKMSADELFVFSVILCDNDIDRDCERFSDNALSSLKSLFIGKTGIFDHKPSMSNQTARIFDTELVTDESRITKNGETYKYLKASAYMVRTEENRNLIAEIDGGIKKEVSISCSAAKRICSLCGKDRTKGNCGHISGKNYGGRLCHTVLDNITDAYEWSFVAVPAQINAGVTKKYHDSAAEKLSPDTLPPDTAEICREIRQLAFFCGGAKAAEYAASAVKGLSFNELEKLKKGYKQRIRQCNTEVQLMPDKSAASCGQFKI